MANLLKRAGSQVFLLDSHPSLITPLFVFVILQELFSELTAEKSNALLQSIGRNFGQQFMLFLSKQSRGSGSQNFTLFLSQLSFLGLGGFVLSGRSEDCVIIRQTNNSLARQYRKSFGAQQQCVDWFARGLLQGGYEMIGGKPGRKQVCVEEMSCMAQAKHACVYSLKKTKGSPPDFPVPLLLDRLMVSQEFSYSSLIARIMSTGQLKFDREHLSIWNIACLNLPFALIEQFCVQTAQLNSAALDVVKFLAEVQTQRAIAFYNDKFGMQDKVQIFQSLLAQQEILLGLFGKAEINEERVRFVLQACVPFEQHRKLAETTDSDLLCSDLPYTAALVEMLVSVVLAKPVRAVRKISEGSTLKEIVVETSGSEAVQSDKQLPVKYKDIILEKTKHTYFLM